MKLKCWGRMKYGNLTKPAFVMLPYPPKTICSPRQWVSGGLELFMLAYCMISLFYWYLLQVYCFGTTVNGFALYPALHLTLYPTTHTHTLHDSCLPFKVLVGKNHLDRGLAQQHSKMWKRVSLLDKLLHPFRHNCHAFFAWVKASPLSEEKMQIYGS